MSACEADRLSRSVFQRIAMTLATAGSAIFDFGAGPGLDARVYAERGHTVDAYDDDPNLRSDFAQHCDDLICAGRVSQRDGSYAEFLTARDMHQANLITSNFAGLNLVQDLRELFARFHSLTQPGARVLASVLNPICLEDLRYRWWWRNIGTLFGGGQYAIEGSHGPIYRRPLSHYAKCAAPCFRLTRVFPSSPAALVRLAANPSRFLKTRASPLAFAMSRYVILLFERLD